MTVEMTNAHHTTSPPDPDTTTSSTRRCDLPPAETGPCQAYLPRYTYNRTSERCESFTYGGCQGNDNRFDDETACVKECIPVCKQPPAVDDGMCKAAIPLYTYNAVSGKCESFDYGGCGGNDNRFNDETSCVKECIPVCKQPPAVDDGMCKAAISLYTYNAVSGKCESFDYGGCGGNDNRFNDETACVKECIPVCKQPPAVDDGMCKAAIRLYTYNSASGKCESFDYGGCGGNDNRFNDETACVKECIPVCKQPPAVDDGMCKAAIPLYTYNAVSGKCESFDYGGCGGNDNRFNDETACVKECIPVCKQPPAVDDGMCKAAIPLYTYNAVSGKCESFDYGGCGGNDNRFNDETACVKECIPVCKQPLAVDDGMCKAAIRLYTYNAVSGKCESFDYGGCGGNDNRFNDETACVKECIPVCKQPPAVDDGMCKAAIRLYTYNSVSGKCESFDYGGCGGNDNQFINKKKCEHACVAGTKKTTQAPVKKDPSDCLLPADAGPCMAYFDQYAYNATSKRCEKFGYGGCQGNGNRFDTASACIAYCDPCLQPPGKPGNCMAYMPKFTYDNGRCVKFTYGGCGGNQNNFDTKQDCVNRCVPKCEQKTSQNGLCLAYMPMYSFNQTTESCEKFIYGGCGGNLNQFDDMSDCVNECVPKCDQPAAADSGHCIAYMPLYTYNASSGQCESFVYGGCGGNKNQFDTEDECKMECLSNYVPPTNTPKRPVCEQKPRNAGPCQAYMPRYSFDPSTGKCEDFVYGGCGGNDNNFQTQDDCQEACYPKCQQKPSVTGDCMAYMPSYSYNQHSMSCERFTYGGCRGNKNRFNTKQECESECSPCNQPPGEAGNCYGYFTKYTYKNGKCEEFVYGGCGGNQNNFDSMELCKNQCYPACEQTPKMTGLCKAYFPRFSYNQQSGKCEKFVYGGCGGNDNRFGSRSKCEAACDPCKRTAAVAGPCLAALNRYTYIGGQCVEFIYGGCRGTSNNFLTKSDCMKQCMPSPAPTPTPGGCTGIIVNCFSDPCQTATCPRYPKARCVVDNCGGCNAVFFKGRRKVDCTPLPKPTPGGCGSGIIVNCDSDPCQTATCAKYPKARCVVDNCGGCNAVFFVGRKKVDCNCGPIINCLVDPCSVDTCPAYPKATCAVDNCGGCSSTFFVNGKKVDCGCGPIKQCLIDPCSVETCPAYPKAVCAVNNCGGCTATFFVNGKKVDCNSVKPAGCGSGPITPCLVDPCSTVKCPRYPKAKCFPDNCGGCNADFFVGRNKVTADCACKAKLMKCFADPCSVSKCPAYPNAKCLSDYCGGCNAQYYVDGKKVDCSCDPTRPIIPCKGNPCGGAKCPANPNAKCAVDNCGGCTATFFDNGKKVDCNVIPPSPCDKIKHCAVSPCNTATCPAYPKADCVVDNCGGCTHMFVVNGKKVDCAKAKPIKKFVRQLPCILPKDRGTKCASTSKTPFYYYNKVKDACIQLDYKGCGGNDNRFFTMEKCEAECVAPCRGTPGVTGRCRAAIPRYTYHANTKSCDLFTYGGCGGNNNNFKNKAECRNTCIKKQPSAGLETDTGIANLAAPRHRAAACQEKPYVTGMCRAYFPSFTFDPVKGKCVRFVYGGCQGNANRFDTEAKCNATCVACDQTAGLIGPCQAYIPRYTFSKAFDKCVRFDYGGCQGNINNFATERECQETCDHPCRQQVRRGGCKGSLKRYAYSARAQKCVSFTYSGCDGSQNNFANQKACENKCIFKETHIADSRVCGQQAFVGKDDGKKEVRYSYDISVDLCVQYIYGGKGGNDNNFGTFVECEATCVPQCQQTSGVGSGFAYFERYTYDPFLQVCYKFVYGGGRGNRNRFDTLAECETTCIPPCDQKAAIEGQIGPHVWRYTFNQTSQKCELFMYGGIGGNKNNFGGEDECIAQCYPRCEQKPGVVGVVGPHVWRYTYNQTSKQCELFHYGGIGGNRNNFDGEEECITECYAPCDQTPGVVGKVGPHIWSYTFNQTTQKCEVFMYGGFGGNKNNFGTEDECVNTCYLSCHQPHAEVGYGTKSLLRYTFNDKNYTCNQFVYKGKGGNKNNFRTLNKCMQECLPVT